MDGQGGAWSSLVRRGVAVSDWQGLAWPGKAWPGEARFLMRGSGVSEENSPHARAGPIILTWQFWRGLARRGEAG